MARTSKFECFPRAYLYADLRKPRGRMVRESHTNEYAFPYSERHLQCVWFDSFYRPEILQSNKGEAIVVEDPGRWNLEAGPDFLDAVLRIGPEQRRVKGDVEIHVHPHDWQNHGHTDDPAYARVVAHVTYFPGAVSDALPAHQSSPDGFAPARRPRRSGALPPGAVELSLRDALQTSPFFSFESVDIAAYPYATIMGKRPPCAEILASWPQAGMIQLLESAGEERLRLKADRMVAGIENLGEDQLLYEEIMCSLGYRYNRIPFRQLARLLVLEILRQESGNDTIKAYSLLLGASGLIPVRMSARWDRETRSFIRLLWDNWWKQQSKWERRVMPRKSWHLSGLRPQNHPVRRLAAAAALFTHSPLPTGERMKVRGKNNSLKDELIILDTADPKSWFEKAESIFRSASIDYWKRRLSFSGGQQNSDIALIGSRRIAAVLSNVVIPFLCACAVPVTPLLTLLSPEEDNSLIRQTAFTLFGRDHNSALYQKGLRQQGLLQIFHDFCLNNKTGCRDCPFASALKKSVDLAFCAVVETSQIDREEKIKDT